MKLPGYLDSSFVPSAPFIYAQLESKFLDGRNTIAFLVDTGASVTIILDRDRETLGLDWKELSTTSRVLTGIGGTVDTRLLNDAALLFRTESGETVKERLPLHVARHDTARLDRVGRERVMDLPSLLGRDLIERYRLVYDKPKARIYLEG